MTLTWGGDYSRLFAELSTAASGVEAGVCAGDSGREAEARPGLTVPGGAEGPNPRVQLQEGQLTLGEEVKGTRWVRVGEGSTAIHVR